MQSDKIEVDKQQLEKLVTTIEEQSADLRALYGACVEVLKVIGLSTDGKLDIEGFTTSKMIQGMKPIAKLFITMKFDKSAEHKLAEKFAFFKPLVPVFEKYAHIFKPQS